MPSDFFPYHTFIAMAWLSSPHQAITCFSLFLYHPLGVATEAALLLRRPSSAAGPPPADQFWRCADAAPARHTPKARCGHRHRALIHDDGTEKES